MGRGVNYVSTGTSKFLGLQPPPYYKGLVTPMIVDIIINELITCTYNCDRMLRAVDHIMHRTTAAFSLRNCDPLVLVVGCVAWVSYVPPNNSFPYVVFDGGGRPRRPVTSIRERTMYHVASVSCVSRHLGRQSHSLLCPASLYFVLRFVPRLRDPG